LPLIVPHVNIAVPHPLSTVPQFLTAGHAVSGVQLEAHVPFAHSIPLGQPPAMVPQLTLPPQPSGIVPQLRVPQTAAAVLGVHPHTFATEGEPPPHVWGDVQPPQEMVPPQPSDTASQFFPVHAAAIVFGVQPHTLGVLPPPHVCGATQLLAHTTVCPQLFRTLPHLAPLWHVCAAVSAWQPQTPMMPPPPQLSPVPAQLAGHCTVRLQLFMIGPHLPPAQVVDSGSSTQTLHDPVVELQPNGQMLSDPH
jgi:hypothetical protein